MTEIEYTLADLIKFSSEQKPLEFGAAFNTLIANKVETAIDSKKIEVAQRMFGDDDGTDNDEETNIGDSEDAEVS